MTSDNPSVNRYLADKAMDHIDHALGRPVWPLRESYRNHFATGSGSDLAIAFTTSPHWEHVGRQGSMSFFAVTDAGRQALSSYLEASGGRWRPFLVTFEGFTMTVPAPTAARARYACFLRLSDSWSELSFGDFLKRARVRAA